MHQIFLSRPSWIHNSCEQGINNFYSLLSANTLSPRTVGVSDYPTESPLDEVIKLMKKCQGTIILGIPQIEILTGTIKDSVLSGPQTLGTEWNHIEGSLAHSLLHPILIIHHFEVQRGLFDRGASNAFLHSVNMHDPSWPMSKQIAGALSNWKEKLINL